MVKTRWWMHLAEQLKLNPFRNPFFARIGNYALYSVPPGTPDQGLGDLAFRPPGAGWAFLHYFARAARNPHWAWWLQQWKIPEEAGEPVLEFVWSSMKPVPPQPPASLPASRLFRGTGVAIMNTTLLDAAENVQVRFKSSPMGRWSHGHDPHNAFTLNAYGVPLLVNNVYRDLYGSPFHREWVWNARSQNAVLVDGVGQKPHSADLGGHIVHSEFHDGFDYVLGDATAAYEGRLTKARRHVFFIKPDIVVLADEVAAPKPSTFQFMLHAPSKFEVDGDRLRLDLDRGKAGVVVQYLSEHPLTFRQWTGYDPPPDMKYLQSVKNPPIPEQWHVETATRAPTASAVTATVLRVYQNGRKPAEDGTMKQQDGALTYLVGDAEIVMRAGGAVVRRGGREWSVKIPE
jgi:hypothetical protein